MRRGARLAIAAAWMTVCASAAIVDRAEVAVGNRVITASEIELRIRLTAFQNQAPLDFSLAERRTAAQRLIDQLLIEREMAIGHYPGTGAQQTKQLLATFEALSYPAGHAAMLTALTKYGLTEDDLRTDLARQADLLTFLSLRFRPGVDVTDAEVRKYFDDKVAEAARRQLGLSGMRAQIEQELARERTDQELDAWLEDQRKRTKIAYPDAELMPAGEATK